jgi:hypothetical protein
MFMSLKLKTILAIFQTSLLLTYFLYLKNNLVFQFNLMHTQNFENWFLRKVFEILPFKELFKNCFHGTRH